MSYANARDLVTDHMKLLDEQEALQEKVDGSTRRLVEEIAEEFNRRHPHREDGPVDPDSLELTYAWRCGENDDAEHVTPEENKSPIGYCVYDVYNDPVRDHCIFCGEPDERK